MIKKIFYTFLILIIGSIFYLSYLGISTSKFNQNIEKKIKDNYRGVDLKLNDVKILLNIISLSIDLETEESTIISGNQKIKLEKVSSTFDLKSFIKGEFAVKNLVINTEKNNIKKFIKLARSYKDGAQLLILDKVIKSGNIKISIKLNFNENGKLIDDKYEIMADTNNLSIELFNKQKIEKISGNLKYSKNKIEISNLSSNYEGIELYSQNISINRKNKNYIFKGDLDSKEGTLPKSIIKTLLKNENIEDIVLSSKNNFTFNISKKFKLSDLNFTSKLNLKKAEFKFDNKIIKNYIPNFKNEITFLDQTININYKNKKSFEGFGKFQIGKKSDDIRYNLEFNKDASKFNFEFDINEIPLEIGLINFVKREDEVVSLKVIGERKNENLILKKINLNKNNDTIKFDNVEISKDFQITNFKKIDLKYLDTSNRKNDILITHKDKNNFLIQGKSFNLSKIIDQILFEDKSKTKLLNDQKRVFKINFQKNYIDHHHHIMNLQGNFIMKGDDILDLSLNSSFPNKDILSMTIKTKNNQKVTTFYSEQAKPFVKKYNFVKGFEGGKIDFYSVKQNKISKSQLKIFEFSLKELPALTKILTLASLQGIADILSGEGVGFEELEMNFTTKKNLLEIDELYAIGPAISILMEGYVQKDQLVSLRGTLVPATTINKFVGSIPILGDILVGKKTGEGVFGVSFKLKGPPKDIKTSVNPIKTLTPRFITRTLEKIKQTN
tara:strand:+ start:51 stop:2228 length:2178 start_codon:yes stop_codon:yes gene_type:complete